MKREFLEGLGLEKEAVDQIMTENGKDINREKQRADDLKTQLDSAKETLKGFEGVDVAQLQSEITKLNTDLAAKDAEHAKALADRDFSDKVNRFAAEYKAYDVKAVMPFLDTEKLKGSKNQENDIKAAFDTLKKENCFLFKSDDVPGGGGNPPDGGAPDPLEAVRKAMGL